MNRSRYAKSSGSNIVVIQVSKISIEFFFLDIIKIRIYTDLALLKFEKQQIFKETILILLEIIH